MIEWKPLDTSALEENEYLIFQKSGRISQVIFDAVNNYFYYPMDGYEVVIPVRNVAHYAEINYPEVRNDGGKEEVPA